MLLKSSTMLMQTKKYCESPTCAFIMGQITGTSGFLISPQKKAGLSSCLFLIYIVYMRLLDAVLLVELVNAAAGVNQLLLAGVEGVALGADFHGDVLLGRTGLDDSAASALDGGLLVIGMDSFLHFKKAPHLMLS